MSKVSDEALDELARARAKFPLRFNSTHEAYGVLEEEVDELWELVKSNGSKEEMRKEAIQVAAMALQFVEDICDITDEQRLDDMIVRLQRFQGQLLERKGLVVPARYKVCDAAQELEAAMVYYKKSQET